MKRAYLSALAVGFLLSACGEDPAFIEKSFETPDGLNGGGTIGSGDGTDGGSSGGGGIDGTTGGGSGGDGTGFKVRKFAFGKSVTPVAADYLFVLDNSVSMVKYSDKVAQGLAAIPAEAFPESSKLAVMTTMVATDPLAANLVAHPDIARSDYMCIDKEPGFLELVTLESVNRFRSCSGLRTDYLAKYSMDACKDGWFAPFAKNSNGQRCFSAALQNSFSPVGCEAGLLALEQILKRRGSSALFRPNAAVNVIFVSDEQEGCRAPETRGEFSTASKLVQMIKNNSAVSSVKFHGIVPLTAPDFIRKYTTEINATGGVIIPMDQERTDYRAVIQRIIESKADLTSSTFDLGQLASGILKVEINGVPTTNYEFDGQRSIKILNLDPNVPSQIVIQFI